MTSYQEQVEYLSDQLAQLRAELDQWRNIFRCDDPQDAVTTTAVEAAELARRMRMINHLRAEVEQLGVEASSARTALQHIRTIVSEILDAPHSAPPTSEGS